MYLKRQRLMGNQEIEEFERMEMRRIVGFPEEKGASQSIHQESSQQEQIATDDAQEKNQEEKTSASSKENPKEANENDQLAEKADTTKNQQEKLSASGTELAKETLEDSQKAEKTGTKDIQKKIPALRNESAVQENQLSDTAKKGKDPEGRKGNVNKVVEPNQEKQASNVGSSDDDSNNISFKLPESVKIGGTKNMNESQGKVLRFSANDDDSSSSSSEENDKDQGNKDGDE